MNLLEAELLEAAITYARLDWHVIPLIGKVPAIKGWRQRATTDEQQIHDWWEENPNFNIGLANEQNDSFVVDVDLYKKIDWRLMAAHSLGQVKSLDDFLRYQPFISETGRGGLHLVFSASDVFRASDFMKLPKGIDKKGEGGYIVAPPSIHPETGLPYLWTAETRQRLEMGLRPPMVPASFHRDLRTYSKHTTEDVLPRLELPQWLLELLDTDPPKGERSDAAWKAAKGLIERGYTIEEIEANFGHKIVFQKFAGRLLEELQRCHDDWVAKGRPRAAPHADVKDDFSPIGDSDRLGGKKKPSPLDHIFSLASLEKEVIKRPPQICAGLIPVGLTILGARPKAGKSWFALALAQAASKGGKMLGKDCVIGDVLYIALEDNKGRLQLRYRKLAKEAGDWKIKLHFVLQWPRGKAAVEALHEWIKSVPNPVLIIVDTYQKVKEAPRSRNGANYSEDYDAGAMFQSFTKDTGVSILLIHHTKKADAEDPFDTLSGTLGNNAAADTLLVIKPHHRQGGMILHCTGRDIDNYELPIAFDKATCMWTLRDWQEGDELSATTKKVMDVLRKAAAPISPAEICAATMLSPERVKKLLQRKMEKGEIIKAERGRYQLPPCNDFDVLDD